MNNIDDTIIFITQKWNQKRVIFDIALELELTNLDIKKKAIKILKLHKINPFRKSKATRAGRKWARLG